MTDIIKTINLDDNIIINSRNFISHINVTSLDVNQVTGEYLLSRPLNNNGEPDGDVWLCPASLQLDNINNVSIIKNFTQTISLYYPYDARFDFTRNKIWICDTGNNRIIKIDKNKLNVVDIIIRNLIYPHAIAVNYNNGGIFVKAFNNKKLYEGIVYSFKSNGELNYGFIYVIDSRESSSTSSESLSDLSSSSSFDIFITLPSPYSIVHDHVRNRIWWVSKKYIYMADENNKQVDAFDISSYGFYDTISIDIEFKTGNAFVIAKDLHNCTYILQIYRDNNKLLSIAYYMG